MGPARFYSNNILFCECRRQSHLIIYERFLNTNPAKGGAYADIVGYLPPKQENTHMSIV